ncbi:MAG: FHA domain-containing protein [Pirellulales bacterium]
MSSLFVIQGRDQGTRFEVDPSRESLVVGRDSVCNIQLHDTEVSRRHAELRNREGHTSIIDLGSSNGVWINAARCERQELSSGDRIQIGRTVLLFTRGGDSFVRDADERVSIVPADQPGDPSRILRAVPQNEASHHLALDVDRSQGNWMARAGQLADHVSHGVGGQSYAGYRSTLGSTAAVDLRMGRGGSGLRIVDGRKNRHVTSARPSRS